MKHKIPPKRSLDGIRRGECINSQSATQNATSSPITQPRHELRNIVSFLLNLKHFSEQEKKKYL